MLKTRSTAERAEYAVTFADSHQLVRYQEIIYLPTDYRTNSSEVVPEDEFKIWRPLSVRDVQEWALDNYLMLFSTAADELSFYFMLGQAARQEKNVPSSLLINTDDGLRELRGDGKLYPPSGEFVPNYLPVKLNTDAADKEFVMEVLQDWLQDEEEVQALLRHVATTLAPHWSAIRYVLLLGDGRNGKSVLMSMIQALFGEHSCSHVTRQDISKSSPVVTQVMGKLVNIVYDGIAEYLKDSGNEKTLIAGEPLAIRLLYSSQSTMVTTNALFIEGLNKEPKSSDKSSALQARLVRFWFPNTYPDDLEFKARMCSPKILGAFLSLLIDNYVKMEDKAIMLAPTTRSRELQLEFMHANSSAMQFILHVEQTEPLGADTLIGMTSTELTSVFQSWRIQEGDISTWSEPNVIDIFRPSVVMTRKSKRVNGQPRKVKVLTAFKKETLDFLQLMKGDANEVSVVDE